MVCSIGRLYAKVNDYAEDNYYTQNQGLVSGMDKVQKYSGLMVEFPQKNITMPIKD